MSEVGSSIVTASGIKALMDASVLGKNIKPKYFKFSDIDYAIDPTIESINGWIEEDISLYSVIDANTIEFVCDIPPEKAAKYTKTAGLYLEDGTLFMIAKPPFPFPPMLRQTFKIQLVYQEAEGLVDFKYIPFYETEQDLAMLNNAAAIASLQMQTAADKAIFQLAKTDYYNFKGESKRRLEKLEESVEVNTKDIEENALANLNTVAVLGEEITKNATQIGLLKALLITK